MGAKFSRLDIALVACFGGLMVLVAAAGIFRFVVDGVVPLTTRVYCGGSCD